jgi:nitrite reductase/ring-hydroxylating ferredoxin subunit
MDEPAVPTGTGPICERSALQDGGVAARFAFEFDGRTYAGIAYDFGGEVHAVVNSCPHRGTELDWQPGQVFDESGLYLVCATHGALFEPDTGRCVGGPCQGASLKRIAVDVIGNTVHLRTGRLVATTPPSASANPSD